MALNQDDKKQQVIPINQPHSAKWRTTDQVEAAKIGARIHSLEDVIRVLEWRYSA